MFTALTTLLWACLAPGPAPAPQEVSDSEPEPEPEPEADSGDTGVSIETAPSAGPDFSAVRGRYDAPFTLTLRSDLSGARILYSLDGSDPRDSTALHYVEPLSIEGTTVVRAVVALADQPVDVPISHTYLFPDQLPDQQAPHGYPMTWWDSYEADYAFDPEIVSGGDYAALFPAVFSALPMVSITLPAADLFGADGIHENAGEDGALWEREASLEWLPVDGGPGFQVHAGLRITGGASRDPSGSPKKSFRLLFRERYGAAELEQDLLATTEGGDEPTDAVDRFDTLVLRARYNHSWAHWSSEQRSMALYMRDSFARELQGAMGHVTTHGRHVHLLINGLYWGLYVLHERPDAHFQAAYFGGEEEEWDVINTSEAVDGDRIAWEELLIRAESADWAGVHEMLDLEAFADYILLNSFLGNDDWPGNNWYAARRDVQGEPFRFFVWDAEHVLKDVQADVLGADAIDSPGRVFQLLRADPEFRAVFSERAMLHLGAGGVLSAEALVARWQGLAAVVELSVVAESARWGDYRRDVYSYYTGPYELYTREDHWRVEYERIREEYLPQRTEVLWQQLVAAELVSP